MYDLKLNTASINWSPLDFPGVAMKTLQQDTKTGAMTVMTRMEPGASIPSHCHIHADETVFVVPM